MKEFGLIGYPLGHSFSQKYFTQKFLDLNIKDAKYSLHPLSEISKIVNVISSHKNLVGLNVTTPYKELVIPYLDELQPLAQKLGIVNTIKIIREGKYFYLKGFNTDVYGFKKTIDKFDLSNGPNKALILGSGGSAKTVAYIFHIKGIKFTHVSRNPGNIKKMGYDKLTAKIIEEHNIIVNATPVGMFPNVDKFPEIPYDSISDKHICIDLVYNPEQTEFLRKCNEQGAQTSNGLTMLYEQADKAWEIWSKSEKNGINGNFPV